MNSRAEVDRLDEPRLPWSRLLLVLTFASLGLFATGIGPRPDDEAWSVFYDLVLYNSVYLC